MPNQKQSKSKEIRFQWCQQHTNITDLFTHSAPTCSNRQASANIHIREEKQKIIQAIRDTPPPPGFAVSTLQYRRTFDQIKSEEEKKK